jgi:NYN domain
MDLSPDTTALAKSRVALLIDGENVSQATAGQIIMRVLKFGELTIRRVYGDATKLPGWAAAPGFRLVHSGTGKNATDLLLTVEAMSLILTGQADVLVIASSNRDFVHLATHLREKSVRVIGIGEGKAPESFRKACTQFIELKVSDSSEAAKPPKPVLPQSDENLDQKIVALIRNEGTATGYQIARLGGRMHALHETKISDQPEKTWRAYLLARSSLYDCDAKGADSQVRLKP